MAAWRPAMASAELPATGFKAVEVAGQSILISRMYGRLVAWMDRCPHAGSPLRVGRLRGEELQCPRHGWLFNITTGCAIPNDPAFALTAVPVKLEGTQVFVEV
jgi:nitrite reductase/ring-hydroxylating ferredoxin subunit